jgi:putative acetyltransferase
LVHPAATPPEVQFRPIQPGDDPAVSALIRRVLGEFGCGGPGSPLDDPELSGMAESYAAAGAAFFVVATAGGDILGCGGFCRRPGTAEGLRLAELRKMHFLPELRGRGVGRRFLGFLLDEMRRRSYRQVCLETAEQLEAARHLYQSEGFVRTDHPAGASGHSTCGWWFCRSLAGT